MPKKARNRVGRWTSKELKNLKLAMTLYGDQSWKKIQTFLLQRQKSKITRSKSIKKNNQICYTYRSIKAIQNKIYQIKPDIELEND